MLNWKAIKKYLLSDGESESHLNHFMKKKQNIIACFALFIIVIITVVLHTLSQEKTAPKPIVSEQKTTETAGILSTDFTKNNTLSELDQQQLQMDRMQKQLSALHQQAQANQTKIKNNRAAMIHKIVGLTKNKALVKNKKTSASSVSKTAPISIGAKASLDDASPMLSNRAAPNAPDYSLETIQFHYKKSATIKRAAELFKSDPSNHLSHAKTARTYVPAGTFAKVVLLEGADANASVNGQSDTVGILVRILDQGTLPNGHHSHLHGCFVLASMYGDISSERAEARLTKISCTRANGTVFEKKVQGYLSFAGKEGIKGHPVMRNGKILMMAGMSGLFSGVGSALQQSTQTQRTSPLGTTSTVNPQQVWQGGAYGGASTAMNQLAQYYIKRADQYHPIIEIGSGTVATVIFQRGFSLLDTDTSTPIPSQAANTDSNHSVQEVKALLQEAQQASRAPQSTTPFTNVHSQ
jgi:conjugal transfer pilus assembly protein TraB